MAEIWKTLQLGVHASHDMLQHHKPLHNSTMFGYLSGLTIWAGFCLGKSSSMLQIFDSKCLDYIRQKAKIFSKFVQTIIWVCHIYSGVLDHITWYLTILTWSATYLRTSEGVEAVLVVWLYLVCFLDSLAVISIAWFPASSAFLPNLPVSCGDGCVIQYLAANQNNLLECTWALAPSRPQYSIQHPDWAKRDSLEEAKTQGGGLMGGLTGLNFFSDLNF